MPLLPAPSRSAGGESSRPRPRPIRGRAAQAAAAHRGPRGRILPPHLRRSSAGLELLAAASSSPPVRSGPWQPGGGGGAPAAPGSRGPPPSAPPPLRAPPPAAGRSSYGCKLVQAARSISCGPPLHGGRPRAGSRGGRTRAGCGPQLVCPPLRFVLLCSLPRLLLAGVSSSNAAASPRRRPPLLPPSLLPLRGTRPVEQAKPARKAGGGARSRRTAGAKGKARFCTALAVAAWTFFLYLHFSRLSGTVQVSRGSGGGDPCRGRYIYMYNLPPRFNADIIRDCRNTEDQWGELCASLANAGLGRPLADRADDGVFTGEAGWYDTHPLALDAIFHNRMKRYECLTNRSAAAAAVFVPFYAGFDFARHQLDDGAAARDAASTDLMVWLTGQFQWGRRMGGRDHFPVAGRAGFDFSRRGSDVDTRRGNGLLMRAARNVSVLVLESTLRHHAAGSDYAVPYPTYFHPRSDADVLRWQERVRGQRRKRLMAFVGAPQPDAPVDTRVREHVIAQCEASTACAMLACARSPGTGSTRCHNHTPANIMRLFLKASFCLQPPGDSWTRRSLFDSMVAGCIPVFFHTASAYKQYWWHLPKHHLNYSVYIPDADVRERNVSIEAVLRSIPPVMVERMREEVIKLIPTVIYADPRSKLETFKDAFDVAVEGILDMVARIKNGEDVNSGRPGSEDPPNLYVSTESTFRPKQIDPN